MKAKVFFLLFLLMFFNAMFSQTVITIQPDSLQGKDARINSVNMYTSGSYIELPVAAWTFSNIPGIDISLIEFDLSIIPPSSNIVLAELYLYGSPGLPSGGHSTASGSNEIIIQRIIENWDEHSVTWNTQPNSTSVNQVISEESTDPYQNFVFNVTDLVRDMYENPLNSFGFLLKPLHEDYYRKMNFCSSDHPERKNHPKLVITCDSVSNVGINSQNSSPFKIFPNPIVDNINISISNNQLFNIVIFNLFGEEMYSSSCNSGFVCINAENFISGLYYLKITSNQAEFVEKIIIQKP